LAGLDHELMLDVPRNTSVQVSMLSGFTTIDEALAALDKAYAAK
jgi:hypothetical protein